MFYLCLPGTNTIQSLSSQPGAWRLPDLIFQRLRINFYRFSSTPKQTPTHLHVNNRGSESQISLETAPQKRPELTDSVCSSRMYFSLRCSLNGLISKMHNVQLQRNLQPEEQQRPTPSEQPFYTAACKCLMYLISGQHMQPLMFY